MNMSDEVGVTLEAGVPSLRCIREWLCSHFSV